MIVLGLSIGLVAGLGAPARAVPVSGPLPVIALARAHDLRTRIPLSLPPDGRLVGYTFALADSPLPGEYLQYSPSGVTFGEGPVRLRAALTDVQTSETISLGAEASSSWAPVWSPDGRAVAYYSDEGGEAGLWVWDRQSRQSHRFPGVVVRPYFGIETAVWSPDGRRLLCKILPAGKTLSGANADLTQVRSNRPYPSHRDDEPSVLVLRGSDKQARIAAASIKSDLAILDLATHTVTRIARNTDARWYQWSPDGTQVGFAERTDVEANSGQSKYGLRLYDVASGMSRTLAAGMSLSYGNGLSWSPDGRSIVYADIGVSATGGLHIVSTSTGAAVDARLGDGVNFNTSAVEARPLWDRTSQNIYAVSNAGDVWRISAQTGQAAKIGHDPEFRFTALALPDGTSGLRSARQASLWVAGKERTGRRAGIFLIDAGTGRELRRQVWNGDISANPGQSLDASGVTGDIFYVTSDHAHLNEIFAYNTRNSRSRRVTQLNPELDQYAMGDTRLVRWTTRDGRSLQGTLLLPPGYQPGQRLPLVVCVYGGEMGSGHLEDFGLFSSAASINLQVLATRGYAVLYPDVPIRPGKAMQDIFSAVDTGVDAMVAQGYGDPDRLAIMGQSYGAYSVLSVITQTHRFKAAMVSADVLNPDLIADYLYMTPNGGAPLIDYLEAGQGGMSVSLWTDPKRYLDNSPIFGFDRIDTPVLISQGDKDISLRASDATFVALRRLGKEVEYRLYEGEGHTMVRAPNIIDFWDHQLEFLAGHLQVARDANGVVIGKAAAKAP